MLYDTIPKITENIYQNKTDAKTNSKQYFLNCINDMQMLSK